MKKPFSDSFRNPAYAGQPFNAQSHKSPVPLDPAEKEAALNRRAELVNETKAKLAPFTEGQNVSDPTAHETWLKYVNDKLRGLEDC